jgi:hypothetical protein
MISRQPAANVGAFAQDAVFSEFKERRRVGTQLQNEHSGEAEGVWTMQRWISSRVNCRQEEGHGKGRGVWYDEGGGARGAEAKVTH